MAETPDDILRALADPQRLAIAGTLAQGDRSTSELADQLELSIARVRKHLNRLTTTGVVRLNDDRRTYRLDPETLRWAAEQAGPSRDAGLRLGAANDEEEAVLRTFFRGGRLTEIPAKASKRHIVLERIALGVRARCPLRREGGQRHRQRLLQRPRGAAPILGRRGAARSRPGDLLASRRPGRRLKAGGRHVWSEAISPFTCIMRCPPTETEPSTPGRRLRTSSVRVRALSPAPSLPRSIGDVLTSRWSGVRH